MIVTKCFYHSRSRPRHPAYSQNAEKLGTSYLQRELNQQLTNHIRKTLPVLRDELLKRLVSIENDIEKYDYFKLDDSSGKTKAMFRQVILLIISIKIHQLSLIFLRSGKNGKLSEKTENYRKQL